MNIEIKDFIGIYENSLPNDFCDHVINGFEDAYDHGITFNRQRIELDTPTTLKEDESIVFDHQLHREISVDIEKPFGKFRNHHTDSFYYRHLEQCMDHYTTKYSALKYYNTLTVKNLKVQRTEPGQGYHIWHMEHAHHYPQVHRVLAFMTYLNTLSTEENGETEFLYCQRRIRPKKGTTVIWPAHFTHLHRGNPVFGDKNKYVITGWIYTS